MADISLIPQTQKQKGLPHFASFQEPPEKLPLATRISFLLFALVIVIGAGLGVWQWSLNNKKETLSAELLVIREQRDFEKENRIRRLAAQLGSFGTLLAEHRNFTRLFEMVEERTVRTVTFKGLEVRYEEATLTLTGTTATYNALAQQIKSFETDENVTQVEVSDIRLNEDGRVEFQLIVGFDQGLLKGVPSQSSTP